MLIFDYEPQTPEFSVENLSIMMNYFSESTDKGKLYINYPSVESFKHFKFILDKEYLLRQIHIDDFIDKSYKQIVDEESCCTDLRKYKREDFNYIILENIKKAEFIEKKKISEDVLQSYSRINENNLFEEISKILMEKRFIPILNTSLFFYM